MKQNTEIALKNNSKTPSKQGINPFCVSVDQGLECTGCSQTFLVQTFLRCSEVNCKSAFCYQCHIRYNSSDTLTQEQFNEMASLNKWKCLLCKEPIEDQNASVSPKGQYLSKKRHRITYKLKPKISNTKNNSNAQIIQNTILKMIYHSIKKIDKIKEPDSLVQTTQSKSLDKENIAEEQDETKNKSIEQLFNLKKESMAFTKKPKGKANLVMFFPNFHCNKQINALIIKSAVVSHSCRVHKGIKKGKPCCFCGQYECPNGIEMVKFKKYEDLICFFNIFFSEIELSLSKESGLEKDFHKKVLKEKEYLFELQDNFGKLKSNMLNGVKTFCSNCIANAFRQNIGVYSIFNRFYNEGEQMTFNLNQTLENEKEALSTFSLPKEMTMMVKKETAIDSNDINTTNSLIEKENDINHQVPKKKTHSNQSVNPLLTINANSSSQSLINDTIQDNINNNNNNQTTTDNNNNTANSYKSLNTIVPTQQNINKTSHSSKMNFNSNHNKNYSSSFNSFSEKKPNRKKKNAEIQSKIQSNKRRHTLFNNHPSSKFIPEKEHNFVISSTTNQQSIAGTNSQVGKINNNQGNKSSKAQAIDFFPFPIQYSNPYHFVGLNQYAIPPHAFTHPYHYPYPYTQVNDPSLLLLHNFFRCLNDKYLLSLDHMSSIEDNKLKTISTLANLLEKATESNPQSIKEQLQLEVSSLNEQSKEKANLLSKYDLELNELQKYFAYLLNNPY